MQNDFWLRGEVEGVPHAHVRIFNRPVNRTALSTPHNCARQLSLPRAGCRRKSQTQRLQARSPSICFCMRRRPSSRRTHYFTYAGASGVTGTDTCPAPAWLQFLIEAGVVQESSLQEDKVFTEDASCRRERFSLVRGVRQAASREQGAESASTTGWTEQVCADEGDKRLDEGENGLRLPCCTCPRQRFWRWHSGLTAQPP